MSGLMSMRVFGFGRFECRSSVPASGRTLRSTLQRPGLRPGHIRPKPLRRPHQLDRLDRQPAGFGRRRDAWPVLRPSRTFKRRQPAARPRILQRRHDRDERARCRALVRAACEGRLWPQQVQQTDVKACRRCAVVGWCPTRIERSRVQWRARGYLGHQVVLLAYSEQGCALMGLCLTCVKWECVPAVCESEKDVCMRP